jgi:hypothetical protein
VSEKKCCLFFEQVVDTYRVPSPTSKKRKRGPDDAEETEAMVWTPGITPEELADIREDDGDEDLDDRDAVQEGEEGATGAPLSTPTLDVWIAAVMEL